MIGAKLSLNRESLPKGWSVQLVGEVGEYINGYPFKPTDWKDTGLPIIRIQNLNDRAKPYNFFPGRVDERHRVRSGDILISWSASLGTYLWKGGDAWLNQHIFKALPNENTIDRAFFYWAMVYAIERIAKNARGSTMAHVTGKEFKNSEFLLPPRSEQRRIAGVLGLVQRAMEQQERLLALSAELKKTLLHQLFTHGLRHEPQKQTEIGPIPKNWEIVPLASLLREPVRNGHSARATNDGTGIRTLTLTAVTRREFTNENTKLTCADPLKVRDMWLEPGDILVERANTPEYVGLAALYEGPKNWAIFPDLMIRVRLDEERAYPYFVVHFLLTDPCRVYFQRSARSTAGNFPKIDQGTVEKSLIPLPTLAEQREISAALRAASDRESLHRRKNVVLSALFRTLLHELMTARLRVQNLTLPTE